MNLRHFLLGCLILAPLAPLAMSGAQAAQPDPVRLDDSLSHAEEAAPQMKWRRRSADPETAGVETWVKVNIHINTRDWTGRSGRIYMVLPRDEASTIEATWTTNGPLLAGRLESGERTLVYAGAIRDDSLRDQLLVRLRSGPDWQGSIRRLNFYFELEADEATPAPSR